MVGGGRCTYEHTEGTCNSWNHSVCINQSFLIVNGTLKSLCHWQAWFSLEKTQRVIRGIPVSDSLERYKKQRDKLQDAENVSLGGKWSVTHSPLSDVHLSTGTKIKMCQQWQQDDSYGVKGDIEKKQAKGNTVPREWLLYSTSKGTFICLSYKLLGDSDLQSALNWLKQREKCICTPGGTWRIRQPQKSMVMVTLLTMWMLAVKIQN